MDNREEMVMNQNMLQYLPDQIRLRYGPYHTERKAVYPRRICRGDEAPGSTRHDCFVTVCQGDSRSAGRRQLPGRAQSYPGAPGPSSGLRRRQVQ